MTTPKLSSEKLLDLALLKNMTRRRLPHILVAFLVNFFTISVPLMMSVGDLMERYATRTREEYLSRAAAYVQDALTFNLVLMFILGIYFGVISLGYMMRRRSAHFYHALPQRRETLYTTSIASALLCAGIGALINLCIVMIEFAVYSAFAPEVLTVFFVLLAKNIIYFLVAYAITVFAGSFSGHGLVQVLMSLVIFFYPIATYYGVITLRHTHAAYFNASFYNSAEILSWLSPVSFAAWNYWGEFQIFPSLLALLVVSALLLGGMAIYRKRSIENSERPIVFKKLGTVLKFMFMFTVTLYAGLFFYAIGYSFFHIIFGFVCGAVLSFMLFNTILAKSPRAMFKGIKGLIIFLIAFALYYTVFGLDVFHMDDYIPAEDNISFAEITISNVDCEDTRFEDPKLLAALSTMLKNQNKSNKQNLLSPFDQYAIQFRITATMYTKLGIPIARTYYVSKTTEGAQEFLSLYADDARMQEMFDTEIGKYAKYAKQFYELSIYFENGYTVEADVEKFIDLYTSELGTVNYARLSQPTVGSVRIRENTRDGDWIGVSGAINEFPLYADMTETIAFLEDAILTDPMAGTYEDVESAEMSAGHVVDTRELISQDGYGIYEDLQMEFIDMYPSRTLDIEYAKELYKQLRLYNDAPQIARIFMAINTDYVFLAQFGTEEDGEATHVTTYGDGLVYVDAEIAQKYDNIAYRELLFFPKAFDMARISAMFD